MSVYGVALEKKTSFQGEDVYWSNVYHFFGVADITEAQGEAIIRAVRDAEKPIHAPSVQFSRGRLWGPTEFGKDQSKMIADLKLSFEPGTGPAGTEMYRELAFVVQWPLGRYGQNNRKQYLRKWLHTCIQHGLSTAQLQGTAQVSQAQSAALVAYITAVTNLNPTGFAAPLQLCTKDGRSPGAGFLAPYLEHHQFGK